MKVSAILTGLLSALPLFGTEWQVILSRDDTELHGKPFPLYRALVPEEWQGEARSISTENTMEAIANFTILTPQGPLRLTVHNFPYDKLEERIAPAQQVARWQRQSGEEGKVVPVHGGGFVGLYFSSIGLLAWSMQLAPEHAYTLVARETATVRHLSRQRRADYTIKVTGCPEALLIARRDIEEFANSFSLIDELPIPFQ